MISNSKKFQSILIEKVCSDTNGVNINLSDKSINSEKNC